MGLSKADKNRLIEIARKSIEAKLEDKEIPECGSESHALKEKRGVFVTLKEHGQLRGCIGFIEPMYPLHKVVADMAQTAAFGDPRFVKVSQDEIIDIRIEISVLTPLKEVENIKEIEVGKHGIYIVRGGHSGLLLPQVAMEYNWDRVTFLEETCYKAGLGLDAWKDENTKIHIFSAERFGED